jgi:hypothetical protein
MAASASTGIALFTGQLCVWGEVLGSHGGLDGQRTLGAGVGRHGLVGGDAHGVGGDLSALV